MMRLELSTLLVVSLVFSACAAPGPVIPLPPTVCVSHFNSSLITPDSITFEGEVVIQNQMRGPLNIQKVDYAADLHDTPFLEDTFTGLHSMRARGTQTVTLSFPIPMSAIVNQVEDVLAEESVRVTLHGSVYPDGFQAIPFEATVVIPPPKIPEVSIDGVAGNPLNGEFTVYLRVKNTNCFALGFQSIDTFLALNGKRYDLLRTDSTKTIEPRDACRIGLTMRQTQGKALSMLVNVAKNQGADFTIGGSICCDTPHGLIQLPVALSSTAAAQ